LNSGKVIVNGVLWFADPVKVSASDDATVVLMNELTHDPLFLNPDYGDYHIGEASAARDAGVPSGVTIDIDGDPRPDGLGWDLGADEFCNLLKTFLPLGLKN
jgi:hypothetical protein